MKEKRKKILVLCSMVLVLIAVGSVNLVFTLKNKKVEVDPPTVTTYFKDVRLKKENMRAEEISILDSIIASDKSSAEAKTAAESKKLAICNQMELETTIEGLIRAKGFSEAVVTISDASVTVVVPNSSLTDVESAKIYSIVTTQTKYPASKIAVFPY